MNVQIPLPVVSGSDIDRCDKEFEEQDDGVPLECELFEALYPSKESMPDLFSQLKQRCGCTVTLTPVNDDTDESIIFNGNQALKISMESEGTRDQYLFVSITKALQGIMIVNSQSASFQSKTIVDLIDQGYGRLSVRVADHCGIVLPESAVIDYLYSETAIEEKEMEAIRQYAEHLGTVYLFEPVEQGLLAVREKESGFKEEKRHVQALSEYLEQNESNVVLLSGMRLVDSQIDPWKMRSLYNTCKEDLKKIQPGRSYCSIPSLLFARDIRNYISRHDEDFHRYMRMLKTLMKECDEEVLNNIAVYFLDENMHVSDVARKLYLHRNTVKYRLNKIQDLLTLDPNDPIAIKELINMFGIYRLSN